MTRTLAKNFSYTPTFDGKQLSVINLFAGDKVEGDESVNGLWTHIKIPGGDTIYFTVPYSYLEEIPVEIKPQATNTTAPKKSLNILAIAALVILVIIIVKI